MRPAAEARRLAHGPSPSATTVRMKRTLMDQSNLPPIWIGPAYPSAGILRKRTLILGESTYAPLNKEEQAQTINHWIPESQITKGRTWGNFQRGIFRTFMTSQFEKSAEHVRAFWESVIFFNY